MLRRPPPPPPPLCLHALSFITVVDVLFINEGTSVSLKQKDACKPEGWRGSKEEDMQGTRMREGQTWRDGGGRWGLGFFKAGERKNERTLKGKHQDAMPHRNLLIKIIHKL